MKFLKKVKVAYNNLPDWLQGGQPFVNNQHEIVFTSGSSIFSTASGEDAARGESLSLLIVDECAFIKNIDDIWTAAYPTMSRGGSAILISTPNGIGNFFYNTWRNADKDAPSDKKNNFRRIFVHWTQIPEYRCFDPVPADWSLEKIKEKAMAGPWYKEQRPQFDDRKWSQEFEGDFLGSGNTVIDPNVLKETKSLMEEPKWRYNRYFQEDPQGEFWMWEKPTKRGFYIIGADTASGDGTDYSTFQVLDLLSGEQVAEYQGKIDTMQFAKLLSQVGEYYNYAMLVPEINNMGYGVVQKLLYEVGYENLFQTTDEQTMKKAKRKYGWVTSNKTRPLLIQALVQYFNSMDFKWRSRRTWEELASFVWQENGKPEADGDQNDDLVFAFAIAAHNRETAMMNIPMELGYEVALPADYTPNVDMWGDPIKKEEEQEEEDYTHPLQAFVESESEEDIMNWLKS